MKKPTTKTTRVEDAYLRLKSELRSNRMPSGFTATETEVADLLGMSRTPVREALIRLELEGLIDLVPRHGMRVLPVYPEDMREIYEILTALEPEAAGMLAARGPSAEELAPLEQATCDMETAIEAGDLDAWAEADDRFHQTLLQLHGNNRLSAFVSSLYDQAHRARIVTLRLRELPRQSTQEHRDILEHLQRGDSKAAREAFRQHRLRTVEELLTALEKLQHLQL